MLDDEAEDTNALAYVSMKRYKDIQASDSVQGTYLNVRFILPTSDRCERHFSAAKRALNEK